MRRWNLSPKESAIDPSTLDSAATLRGQPVSLWEYVLAVRPKLSLYALFGTLICMAHFAKGWVWPCAVAGLVVGVLTAGIMLWNDFVDRHHDIGKGRTLAVRQPLRFLAYVGCVWSLALCGVAWVWSDNAMAGVVLAALAANGFVYGWFRVVPLLSGLSVAFSFASLVLIGAAYVPEASAFDVGVLVLCVFAMSFGRENAADLEDLEIDARYKTTLSVFFGPAVAVWVIIASTVVSLGAALIISPLCLVALPFACLVVMGLRASDPDFDRIQWLYDVQCLLVMVILPFV